MIYLTLFILLVLIFGLVVLRGAPYVPSHAKEVRAAFTQLYQLDKNSVLLDVGSGDGLILRIAAAHGAKAIGIELNPILVLVSRVFSLRDKKISVRLADFWLSRFPDDTTIVYAFSVSRDQKKLAEKMQTESNRLKRRLSLMTYGAPLKDRKSDGHHRAHNLYEFYPLQKKEA